MDAVHKYPHESEYTRFLRARGRLRDLPRYPLVARSYSGSDPVGREQADLELRLFHLERSLSR